jgi:glycosyltransferase involved in cell wall biosynthesis
VLEDFLETAMACGLPPVAADASGVREIFGVDSAGTLVPRDDRVEAVFARDLVGAQLRSLFFPG